jgi:hypothetical protein
VINLSSFNSICQDTSATKKSQYCIRIEKVIRESDSISSNLSYREAASLKKATLFLAFADSEGEMQDWITILEKRLGGRNIADIVLDRLELVNSLGMHRRQGSYGSLNSFYSKNSSFCSSGGSTSESALSSRRPSLDSLSLDTPSLDSRKSSIDSFHSGRNSNTSQQQPSSRPETPSTLVERLGIGQPILRKPASHSCLQDRRSGSGHSNSNSNNSNHVRKLSLTFKESPNRIPPAPLIMVHGENSKFASSPDVVYFPGCNKRKTEEDNLVENPNPPSPVTPIANVFPSHLTDNK